MNKKSLTIIISCALAWIGLIITATFLDLKINIALQNPSSLYGQFFAKIGEIPLYAAAPAAGIILFHAVTRENRFYTALKVINAAVTFAAFFVMFIYISKNFFDEGLMYKYVYITVFAAAFTSLGLLGTMKIDKRLMKKLVVFAVFILTVIALSQIITAAMKIIWGRLRFRNLNADYEGFTRWYVINWKPDAAREGLVQGAQIDGAFKSFPSGHTSSAGVSFVLIMLPDLFEKLKKYKAWFYIVPAVYTTVVALSRIVNMAHYLSDVLFGFLISALSALLLRQLILFLNKKYGNKISEFLSVKKTQDIQQEELT